MIELRDIYKLYHMGDTVVRALDGINLNIDEGEFVARFGQIDLHEYYRLSRCAYFGDVQAERNRCFNHG